MARIGRPPNPSPVCAHRALPKTFNTCYASRLPDADILPEGSNNQTGAWFTTGNPEAARVRQPNCTSVVSRVCGLDRRHRRGIRAPLSAVSSRATPYTQKPHSGITVPLSIGRAFGFSLRTRHSSALSPPRCLAISKKMACRSCSPHRRARGSRANPSRKIAKR